MDNVLKNNKATYEINQLPSRQYTSPQIFFDIGKIKGFEVRIVGTSTISTRFTYLEIVSDEVVIAVVDISQTFQNRTSNIK